MYTTRPPAIIKPFMREMHWRVPGKERRVFLTFDDGPDPQVTPWVLDTLAEYGAKATFFCIGRNVAEQPELFERIRREGHGIGNHTWSHEKGWTTPTFAYMRSVLRCHDLTRSLLFRPPYGRIGRSQAQLLAKRFRIVMWDVLSGDFDPSLSGEQCRLNVLNATRPGSIIVFHDSMKASPSLREALPGTLAHLRSESYEMTALSDGMFMA